MTGSYCLSKKSQCHHIILITAYAQNVRLQTLTPLANSTFNNRVTQSGPLAVDGSFQFVDVQDRLAPD